MALEIRIPSVGESISEVVIANWLKADGSLVKKDEAVLEVETDKVNQELVAPDAGILRVVAKEGETVRVGAVVATIEPADALAVAAPPAKPDAATKHVPPAPASPVKEPFTITQPLPGSPAVDADRPRPTTVAQKVAAELNVDLAKVEGHGSHGRVTKDDVLAHVAKPAPPVVAPVAPAAAPAPSPAASAAPAGNRGVRREKMTTLRKRIASRLVEAQQTAAILTTFNEADMSAVMDLRAKYKDSFQKKHGIGLGFMSFFVKAAIEALRAFPRVNAYIEGDEIVYHDYADIGVAVSSERGLVVPVLRNAEALSFAGIEKAIREYGEKAKAGKLTVEELTGGTFTISNGGIFGSMMSTPILNPPQSGILGMHNIVRRPVAVNEQVVIRPMMYLALSYDHRIIDGKEAVGFLVRIKECIESPERMLLDL